MSHQQSAVSPQGHEGYRGPAGFWKPSRPLGSLIKPRHKGQTGFPEGEGTVLVCPELGRWFSGRRTFSTKTRIVLGKLR